MANKDIDNEPMLEENSDEILLEESSGTEAMLEEAPDSEVLLEETAESETVMLEETQEESILLEETSPAPQQSGSQPSADATATVAPKPKAQKATTHKPKAQASTSNNASSNKRSTKHDAQMREEAIAKLVDHLEGRDTKEYAEKRKREAKKERLTDLLAAIMGSLLVGLAFPLVLIIFSVILNYFSGDSWSFSMYLWEFVIASVISCFTIAKITDNDEARPYFYGLGGVMAVILVILIWKAFSGFL